MEYLDSIEFNEGLDDFIDRNSISPEAEDVFSKKHELSPAGEKKALQGIQKIVEADQFKTKRGPDYFDPVKRGPDYID